MTKRLILVLVSLILLLFTAACGSNNSAKETTAASYETANNETQETANLANGLPQVPEIIKDRGKLIVGVKSDYPPFGYINEKGENAGFDIDLAKKIAELAFGDSEAIEFVSVNASNRIPFLTTKKVDLLIATLGVTEERKQQIDFTNPYFNTGVLFLVPKDSEVNGIEDLENKDVIAIKGSLGSIELEKIAPSINQIKLDSTSEGVRALKDGRGLAMIQDDILLYDIAKNNQDLKVVGEPFGLGLMAIGIRKGEEEWVNWLNGAIDKIKEEDLFYQWFKNYYPEDTVLVPEYLPRP